MAASSNPAHPVATLREQAAALHAAMTECLADAAPKSVHRVRTATRRIEAQLHLLAMLPELPEHAKSGKEAARRLRQLRREAGRVRDIDVLRQKLTRQIDQPGPWNQDALKQAQKESAKLQRFFKRKRLAEAETLVHLLAKRQTGIEKALDRLLKALEPSDSLTISTSQLVELATGLFQKRLPPDNIDLTEDQLHDVRKTAKLVRYLLESTPEKAGKVRKLARHFEDLQETGGEWHDLLTLAERCRKRLGKHSLLAIHAAARRDQLLAVFRERLQQGSSAATGSE